MAQRLARNRSARLPPSPTAMYICICNAITERQIIQAAEGGARTTRDLAHGLGVGLGCGRCTSCAKDLLVEAVGRLTAGATDLAPSLDGDAR